MFEGCAELVAEFDDIERQLADPAIHSDVDAARRLARRHAELKTVVEAYRLWLRLGDDEAGT